MTAPTPEQRYEAALDRLEELIELEGEARYEGHPRISKHYLREIRKQEKEIKKLAKEANYA